VGLLLVLVIERKLTFKLIKEQSAVDGGLITGRTDNDLVWHYLNEGVAGDADARLALAIDNGAEEVVNVLETLVLGYLL
jgi:hypothetical protein